MGYGYEPEMCAYMFISPPRNKETKKSSMTPKETKKLSRERESERIKEMRYKRSGEYVLYGGTEEKKKKAKRKQSCLHKQTKKNLNNEHNTNLLYDMSFLNLGISQLDLKAKTLQPSHKKKKKKNSIYLILISC